MNLSDVLKALKSASAFELFRMPATINHLLDGYRWVLAVQSRLRIGQTIEYFDAQSNKLRQELVLELRRKQAVVLDSDDGWWWLISYVAINLPLAEIQIREQPMKDLRHQRMVKRLAVNN